MNLRINQEGRVRRLTLARVEKRNALDAALCGDLLNALDAAESDAGTGAILLDAEGPVFCAGMDLDEAVAEGPNGGLDIHERLFTFGFRIAKPVIAAVHGPALAGGIGILANCHVVVAAMGTSFGITEMRIGMFPFVIFRALVHAIGERAALELSLTARIFQTDEALRMGLIHHAAPAVELEDRAMGYANAIAESSPMVQRFGMAYLHQARYLGAEEAGHVARELRAHVFRSADFAEGVAAFREKRKPVWQPL